jgi:hypothetical protein
MAETLARPGAWPQVRRSRLEVAPLKMTPPCLWQRTMGVFQEWGIAGAGSPEDFLTTAELLISERACSRA